MRANHDIIEINAEYVHQTEKGFCVKNLKGVDTWLPKSLLEIEGSDHRKGQWVKFQMPEGMATDKELV